MGDLRTATAEDWSAFTGLPVPASWIGLVAERAGAVVGIGALVEDQPGVWVAMVQRAPGVTGTLCLMRGARILLDTARSVGVPVQACADSRIDGAERFLARIGFEWTGETIGDHRMMQWTP